jgi:DNA-binding transcriptional LysR family regulator
VQVSKAELGRHPQVVVKSSDEKAPDTGLIDEAPKWFVTDMSMKKELILTGLGWGRLPDHMVEDEITRGALLNLPTLGDLSLPVCLTKRAGQHLGPVGQRVWENL